MDQRLPVFLTAEWRYLAMLNFQIDPLILGPYIPAGTELDQWEGKTFISVVGFLFQNTRVCGMPIPFHRNFEEVNLRFYVRRKENNDWQRAVVFIKEIVPRRAIAWAARALYNENYISLPMGHDFTSQYDGEQESKVLRYWWGGRDESYIEVGFKGEPSEVRASSVEEFITEHYLGFAHQKDGGSMMYRVEHPKWKIWNAENAKFCCDVRALYGCEFVESLSAPPTSAFLADGSAITVSQGLRLPVA